MQYVRFILLITLLFNVSACKYWHSNWGGAHPASSQMELNYGPEYFRQGYKEGCESGYSGYGNNFNKQFHTWKQDPQMVLNEDYYRIWKDAYSYCAFMAMMNDEHGLGNWR